MEALLASPEENKMGEMCGVNASQDRGIVMRSACLFAAVVFWFGAAAAGDLRLDGPLTQGGLLRGVTEPGAEVVFDGHRVEVSTEGLFLVGFGRDDTGPFALDVRHPDGTTTHKNLAIKQRQYAIQRIDGLPPKMVTPDPAVLDRIRRENGWIAEVRARDTPEALFAGGFVWPVVGPISGVYGSQRILNGEPRRPHYGVDIAAPEGTPVRAPADGIVALAANDLYYTGGTVMLDHGYGLTSVYSHMSAVTVSVGMRVARGDVIGRVGATGRVTGPHLDWRINLFKTRLDPELVVGPMPGQ
ncbi:MAG: M23 family metallopeptidase [Alphaproteobacteria bacterium]